MGTSCGCRDRWPRREGLRSDSCTGLGSGRLDWCQRDQQLLAGGLGLLWSHGCVPCTPAALLSQGLVSWGRASACKGSRGHRSGRAGLWRVWGGHSTQPSEAAGSSSHLWCVSRSPFLCPESVGGSCRLPSPGQGPLSPDGHGRGCEGSGRGSWGAQSSFPQDPSSGGDGGVSRAHPTECRCSRGAVLLCGPRRGSFLLPHLAGRVSDVTRAARRPCRDRGETPTTRWTSRRPPTVCLCFQDRFTPRMPLTDPSSLPSPSPPPGAPD